MNPLAIPSLHAGEPDPSGWLFSNWMIQPGIAAGLFVLLAAYILWTGPLAKNKPDAAARITTRGQRVSFVAGVLVILVALGPPLDDWSDHYLLLAHMVQHMLLMLLAPPLLLRGIPAWVLEPLTRNRVTNWLGYTLTRAPVAFAISAATVFVWHIPVIYTAALYSDMLHATEHMLFLVTSILMWWPIVGPLPAWPRLSPPAQCLYFFLLALPGSFVGAFITYADPGLYAPYDLAPRVFGIPLIVDQQAAGLLMWVGGGTIYLLLITFTFLRWAGEQERADEQAPRAPIRSATTRPNPVAPQPGKQS